jgi:hypothetical protein
MELKEYFESKKGLGVLATSDSSGNVNAAIYARPHIDDDGNAKFIMADRLSHSNVVDNPNAAYIFKEEGFGYKGKRLILKLIAEETDVEKIDQLRRRSKGASCEESEGKITFLVTFKIVEERPLINK